MPNYWFDVFTEETWEEARAVGFTVSGFSRSRYRSVQQLQPSDILICYLKKLKVLIGALRIDGPAYLAEQPPIWKNKPFPARVPVKPAVILDRDQAVDFPDLLPHMSFFNPENTMSTWANLQGSPTKLTQHDGEVLWSAILAAGERTETKSEAVPAPVAYPKPAPKSPPALKIVDPLENLVADLEQSQRDIANPARFEQAIAQAFRFLGLDATWKGQAGTTDVIVDSPLGHDRFVSVVDAKASSSGKVLESQINWPAINDHRHKAGADYAVVVGEHFAGGNLLKFAVEYSTALIETSTLIEVLRLHARTPFFAADLRPLLATAGLAPELLADLRQKADATARHWQLIAEIVRFVDAFSRKTPPVVITLGLLHGALLATKDTDELTPSEQDVRDAVGFLTSRAIGVLRAVEPAETAGYRLAMSPAAAIQRLTALNSTYRQYLMPSVSIATGEKIEVKNSSIKG